MFPVVIMIETNLKVMLYSSLGTFRESRQGKHAIKVDSNINRQITVTEKLVHHLFCNNPKCKSIQQRLCVKRAYYAGINCAGGISGASGTAGETTTVLL